MKRAGIAIAFVGLALIFLFVSILRTARPRYSFKLTPTPAPTSQMQIHIGYTLPATGFVGPNHVLWPLEVARDKLWLAVTLNPLKKAEIALLLSDKRLSSAIELSETGEYNRTIPTIIKSEMYLHQSSDLLETADKAGYESVGFAGQLALASLKHREVLEGLITHSPEDAKPIINKTLDNAKFVYETTTHILQNRGLTPPSNPFEN